MHFPLIFFQLKKLVYVYLVRYAEEQQDLALLSISTFQRALKVYFVFYDIPIYAIYIFILKYIEKCFINSLFI